MDSPTPKTPNFRLGSVDDESEVFELRHGEIDAPRDAWVVVARLGGDDTECPVVELTKECEAAGLVDEAKSILALELDRYSDESIVYDIDPDGTWRFSWRGTLTRRAGSSAHWYSDWHWSRRRRSAP